MHGHNSFVSLLLSVNATTLLEGLRAEGYEHGNWKPSSPRWCEDEQLNDIGVAGESGEGSDQPDYFPVCENYQRDGEGRQTLGAFCEMADPFFPFFSKSLRTKNFPLFPAKEKNVIVSTTSVV